jgi:hypothetical protein
MAWMAVITTLFDLIDALHEEVEPGAEDEVTATVWHLYMSGRLRFLRTPPDDETVVHASSLLTRKKTYVAGAYTRW